MTLGIGCRIAGPAMLDPQISQLDQLRFGSQFMGLPQTNFEEFFGVRFLPGHIVQCPGRTRDSQDFCFFVPFPSQPFRFFDRVFLNFLEASEGFEIHIENTPKLFVGELNLFQGISLFETVT
jgi:hypothetical protein